MSVSVLPNIRPMKPSQIARSLEKHLPARNNVMIVGSPGLGKTSVIEQVTQALIHDDGLPWDMVLSHPSTWDPTNVSGFPELKPTSAFAEFKPFGDLWKVLNAKRPTVWFLDDFGLATEAVQGALMQFFLARECNGMKLSDHVRIVIATNKRTDKAGVTGILEPVKSRFVTILHMEADLQDWREWALDHDVDYRVLSYVGVCPDLLHKFSPSADLTNSPSPRTWDHASQILKLDLDEDLVLANLAGAIGLAAATAFHAQLSSRAGCPNPDHILINPDSAPIPDSPHHLMIVSRALAFRAKPANWAAVVRYTERLHEAGKTEFAIVLYRSATKRTPALAGAFESQRITCGPIGRQMQGEV